MSTTSSSTYVGLPVFAPTRASATATASPPAALGIGASSETPAPGPSVTGGVSGARASSGASLSALMAFDATDSTRAASHASFVATLFGAATGTGGKVDVSSSAATSPDHPVLRAYRDAAGDD